MTTIKNIAINPNVSVEALWHLANNAFTLERCAIAEKWIDVNKNVSVDEASELYDTIAYQRRDIYRLASGRAI